MKRFALIALVTVGLASAAAPAHAALTIVDSANDLFFPGSSQFKIFNYENLIKGVDNDDPLNQGTIEVGDRLRGIVTIVLAAQGANINSPDGSFELTGLFDVEVASVDPYVSGESKITFVPYVGFKTELAGIAGGVASDYDGAMLAIFNDVTPDFLDPSIVNSGDIPTAVGQAESTATDGSLYLLAGSTGTWGTDYYWAAQGPADILTNFTVNTQFSASLDVLINNSNQILGPVTQTPPTAFALDGLSTIIGELAIKGSVKGNDDDPSANSYMYPLRSDDPVTVRSLGVIPEPSSLLIWSGAGIIGVVVGSRRRKAKCAS